MLKRGLLAVYNLHVYYFNKQRHLTGAVNAIAGVPRIALTLVTPGGADVSCIEHRWRPDDRCLAHPECNFLDPEWHLHIMANCSVIVLGETDYPHGSSRTILQVLVFIPVTSHVTSTLSAWEEQPLPVSPLQLPFVYYYAKRQPHNASTSKWSSIIVQGSGIGPCVFIVYIMDLKPISSFNTILKYADDTTLLVPQNCSITLQAEFSRIRQ